MRYIYYIIIILLAISAGIGYELRPARTPEKKAALIVNKRVITLDEFDCYYAAQPSYLKDRDDCINSMITKELLIQESQREGIDKDESFRKSIQNFYEQSLIKLLIDRKLASLQIISSDDELNKYISLLDKKLYLTIFSFAGEEEARKGNYKKGETKTAYFEDLSKDIRNGIIALKNGKMTEPIRTGGEYIVVRLDRMESYSSPPPSPSETERIRKMLTEEKREKIINDWISDLKKKASIKNLLDEKTPGG